MNDFDHCPNAPWPVRRTRNTVITAVAVWAIVAAAAVAFLVWLFPR